MKIALILIIIIAAFALGVIIFRSLLVHETQQMETKNMNTSHEMDIPTNTLRATFAGGCFWCMEPAFERLDGVYGVRAGFTGGSAEDANYYKVASGATQHREAIDLQYDPTKITYERLVEVFFWQIDPTDDGGQFADRGYQYTTAIFYHNDEQKQIAEEYIKKLEASGEFDKPVVTAIEEAQEFYDAPEEHQNYYLKNPTHYKLYKKGSGREDFIEKYNDYQL